MSDWGLFFRVVGPLLTVGVTLLWWLVVVTLQTPRRYWRDHLSLSILGVLAALSVYVIVRALVRMTWLDADAQLIVMLGAVFAVMGWPALARETRRAWRSWRRDDLGGGKKGDSGDG